MFKKTFSICALMLGVLSISACTTTAYNTNNSSVRAAGYGAALGAAIGALARSDGDRSDIGKGAAVGAAVGAAAGYGLSNTQSYPYK